MFWSTQPATMENLDGKPKEGGYGKPAACEPPHLHVGKFVRVIRQPLIGCFSRVQGFVPKRTIVRPVVLSSSHQKIVGPQALPQNRTKLIRYEKPIHTRVEKGTKDIKGKQPFGTWAEQWNPTGKGVKITSMSSMRAITPMQICNDWQLHDQPSF